MAKKTKPTQVSDTNVMSYRQCVTLVLSKQTPGNKKTASNSRTDNKQTAL